MKITFPHMGKTYLPVKAMFDDLGVEFVVPPKNSKKTLEIGTKYSPELICLPMKINLGNYIESIEKGADTIIVTGSCGPCRYGYFVEVEKEILKDLGYDAEFVVLEAPNGNKKEFFNRVSKVANTKNMMKIANALKNGIKVLRKLDRVEESILKLRPYEKNKGEMDQLYNALIKSLEKSTGTYQMAKVIDQTQENIESVKLDKNREILKVGIIGEIYTIIEDFANIDIGKKLNELGVAVHKSHTASGWIFEHLFYNNIGSTREKKVYKAANPYMKTMVGGHGRETIGNAILYAEEGYDGVIQVMPFTCMPEIVAMSLLPQIQNDKNIPILTLIIDEMTGEAGYVTRLEAYIDLLRNRRGKHKNEKMLSWR
ncbi:2-hydroxyacyl-CoA dehydratase [Marinisporobacter balticus]|uniref:Putative nucleotide-binding protein (Sugar kinase/HSP70/actin superfamily) n=1 Tax=Marinisporobacter balticus TaxID=2018667 RepID=A0A4R2KYQ4_9FIRM|nr:2-hydroxyacyl-CoA dehydratase [Marinisporobacter balticus]TCO76486.1 putative nucleotide-binding protein (sugar kinase/HSP70/actin superfamily) [Marinisporobacter balticus]